MSNKSKKIMNFVMAGVLAGGVAGIATHAVAADKAKSEKCYGIAKAGKNDCGTATHSCAGQSKQASNPKEWIYVMKGNCNRIVGGSLKSANGKKTSMDQKANAKAQQSADTQDDSGY